MMFASQTPTRPVRRIIGFLLKTCLFLGFVIGGFWLALALWIQQPFGYWLSWLAIGIWVLLSIQVIGSYIFGLGTCYRTCLVTYLVILAVGIIWFLSIAARNDRDWNPEVEHILNFHRDENIVTIDNVRNFHWYTEDRYDAIWETRQYDINKLQSIDLVVSYWASKFIAHTLISFNFSDGKHLTFSVEIRKEKGEEFSILGGFFKQYELAVIAADEQDIVFTRSNIRHEQVYIYPLRMGSTEVRELFLSYLTQARKLRTTPTWYNTLTSNCTTLHFAMVNNIEPLPLDYRVILSGKLPSWLYDHQALSPDSGYSLAQWNQMAYTNPRVKNFAAQAEQTSAHYSQLIRSGWPAESHTEKSD